MCNKERKIIQVINDTQCSIYSFLSNEYIYPIRFEGDIYLNIEAALAASMITDHKERKKYEKISGIEAKLLLISNYCSFNKRENWDNDVVKYILTITFNKFYYNEGLKSMLLDTDDSIIIYIPSSINSVCDIKYLQNNIFGKAIMVVRDAIRDGESRKVKVTYDITNNGISVSELDLTDKIYNRKKINEKFYDINKIDGDAK